MATDLIVPKIGESITEAVVAKWLKNVGESVAIDEPVVALDTDKVSMDVPSPTAGVLTEQRFAAGATVKIGEVLGAIDAAASPVAAARPVAVKSVGPAAAAVVAARPAAPVAAPSPVAAQVVVPAPAAVAAAASASIAAHLTPAQRQKVRDGEPVAAPSHAAAAAVPAAVVYPPPAPDEELVAMTPLRKTLARRLVEAQHTAAILTTFNEVDLHAVMGLRARFQDDFTKKHGVKLGFMSFFARACVESLRDYPGLNAEVRGTDILYKKHYDFGIAVGGGKGLVVPVVRHIDTLSFAEIEKSIADLGARAKDGKLTLNDLAGGTFTITNGGIYGSMMSTPLLNMPQTGILGMHNIVKRPVVVDDQIVVRPMMYLALSYDHRVVDGREAVQFLVGVKQRLEAPERLLFSI